MKQEERIDRLERRLQSLDKKVWLIIVIIVALGFNEGNGALAGILTGAAVSEVEGTMNPAIFFLLVAVLASLYRAYLGFRKAQEKNPAIQWDWEMVLISVVPSAVAGFATGAFSGMEFNMANAMMVFFAAAGLNSLQDKFGLQKKK